MPRTGHIQYYCITPQSFSQPGAADLPSQSICRENCKTFFSLHKSPRQRGHAKNASALPRWLFAVDLQFGQYTYRLDMACDGKYAGCIVIEDEIKADAPAAIKLLKSAGIRKTVMLTGDADAVGKKVAGQLHLDQVYTELLPADKVDRVESLLKQKSEKGMLAFVGDGINDAPVLARADVGIAMGGLGSDAAIEAADVVLMTDEPSKIAAVMKIARKTIRIANQNIVFALGVKFLVLILGALGYANMWAAVFADVGVSIIAILNAIRAMRVKLPDMPAGSTNQG